MSVAVITGSAGLVGSEAAVYFADSEWMYVGIDNGMRAEFFRPEASTQWVRDCLCDQVPRYFHHDVDIPRFRRRLKNLCSLRQRHLLNYPRRGSALSRLGGN